MESLRAFHLACAFLHVGSAIALAALTGNDGLSLESFWLSANMTELDEVEYLADRVGSVPLTWLAVAPALVSGVFHVACVVWYETYVETTETIAIFRWADYSLSSPMMAVVLASLSGVWSAGTLVCIALLQFCTIVIGALADYAKDNKEISQRIFLLGWIPYLGQTLVSLITFGESIDNADGSAPLYVWFIVLGLHGMFASFGFLEGYIRFSSKTISWEYQEFLYGLLSITAKTTLHWLIWSGTKRNSNLSAVSGAIVVVALIAGLGVWRHMRAGYRRVYTG